MVGLFSLGDFVIYSIIIINQGDFLAYNVEIIDYILFGLNFINVDWVQNGNQVIYIIFGLIVVFGGIEMVIIDFEIDDNYMGAVIINYVEISVVDDDNDFMNIFLMDVDFFYDNNLLNDVGGVFNFVVDDVINGNGIGVLGSGIVVMDEDDYDLVMIMLNNCNDLLVGIGMMQQLCLFCILDEINYDLFGVLVGILSLGGFWQDVDGVGVSLFDLINVDFVGVLEGSYDFVYIVGGMGMCLVIFVIVIIEFIDIIFYGCNDQVNVIFGISCEILVMLDMVLEGILDCMGFLQVNLINESGVFIGNMIIGNEVGQLLIVEVIDLYCGLLCWGNIWVMDVIVLMIVCFMQEVDLVCNDFDFVMDVEFSFVDFGQLIVLDNCVDYNIIIFIDEMVMGLLSCEGQCINCIFIVIDLVGNFMICVQEINFCNLLFSDIMQLDFVLVVFCDQLFNVDLIIGNLMVDVIGFLMIDGYYNDYFFDGVFCDFGVIFEDGLFIQVCDGMIKFVWEWIIIDWCLDGGDNVIIFIQLIKIGDEEGLEVIVLNVDIDGDGEFDLFVYFMGIFDCIVVIVVLELDVIDNCFSFEIDIDIFVEEVVFNYNQYGQLIGYDII